MISKTHYCILYDGMPIDGVSTSTGRSIPIFSVNTRIIPNMIFDTHSNASAFLHSILLETLNSPMMNPEDIKYLSVGNVQTTYMKFDDGVTGYDIVMDAILKNSPHYISLHLPKIIHECVKRGFRTVLPLHHNKLLTSSEFSEHLAQNVPFFVQQNIERFMDAGITTCTPDEIGAIILTSTDELLKAIQIDSFNVSK